MKVEKTKFESTGDFLVELKRELEREDNELAKVVELKRVKQESKIIEEFVQEFK